MKLSARRKYVLYKLAFTHEVKWAERPSFLPNPPRMINEFYPTLDGQDISCVIRSMRKERLVRAYAPNDVLCITAKGMDALLETVT